MNNTISYMKKSLISGSLVLALFVICGVFCSETVVNVVSRIAIMSLYAISFNLMFGYTGMTSIGHALYFGYGGYALMICLTRFHMPLPLAVLCAVVSVIPVAWFLGTAALKNDMLTFSFLTMGLCTTVQLIIFKTQSVGGTVGITSYFLPDWLNDFRVLYFFILGCVTLCVLVLFGLNLSPYAQILKGVRDNNERMVFTGLNVRHLRVSVFVISALFADIAGILYAFRNSGVYTTALDGAISNQAIMMCIVGGKSSFFGPILGSAIITTLQNWLSLKTRYFEGVIGIVILITAYWMRGGLIGPEGLLAKVHVNKLFEKLKKESREDCE